MRLGVFPQTILFLFLFMSLSACGGGGGGSGGGVTGSYEIVYVLAQNSSNSSGELIAYPLNTSNGTFYNGITNVSTGGTTPVSLLTDPSGKFLYVLNGNGSTNSSPQVGSISSLSAASQSQQISVITSGLSTGKNPVNMVIDPGGNYLVVVDHNTGQTGSGAGDVTVYKISSSGSLTNIGQTTGSTGTTICSYPFRAAFDPGSTGSSSDWVYIACSAPEDINSLFLPPPIEVFPCQLSTIAKGSCGQSGRVACYGYTITPVSGCDINTTTNNPNEISFALYNFTFYGNVAYGVMASTKPVVSGQSPVNLGSVLLACTLSGSTMTCPTVSSPSDFPFLDQNDYPLGTSAGNFPIPSGNVAFSSSSIFVGNYAPVYTSSPPSTTFTNGQYFSSCLLSSPYTCNSGGSPFSISNQYGPIAFATNSTTLFIAATVTPVNDSPGGSTYATTGGSAPANSYIYSCALSNLSSCSTAAPLATGGWPLNLTLDPSGNYLFAPTLSGSVSMFQGASSGNLSEDSAGESTINSNLSGNTPLQVLVTSN